MNVDIKGVYDQLWDESIVRLKKNEPELDSYLAKKGNDDRRGVTLLAKLNTKLTSQINHLLHKLRKIEPNQYFYHPESMHLTILSIISCTPGFHLSDVYLHDYIQIIEQSLQDIKAFSINFKGITTSKSSVLIQGFPKNHALNLLRNRLRENFKNSQLLNSIDKRYILQTAHCTVIRYTEPFKNPLKFVDCLESQRDTSFGIMDISEISLVFNNWYQSPDIVKTLHTFKILPE